MNKVTLALATSTVGLALTSAYLCKQLDAEREGAQIAATQYAELQTHLAKLQHQQHPASTPPPATTAAPAPGVARAIPVGPRPEAASSTDIERALYDIRLRKRWQEAGRQMLADPRGRELLKTQARSEARAAHGDLARELQLTDVEFDRLVELLAEHDLQVAEVYGRDDSNVTADTISETQALRERLAQEVADLLGYEKAQQYESFVNSRQVRTQVRRLRGRLSEGDALTDEQNQRLIAVLQKQRLDFNEAERRRVPPERVMASRGTADGGAFLADKASAVPMQEQLLKRIEEFRKRQLQGAADVLTARQLRVFAQMQDEMLIEERLRARQMTLVDEVD